jgi:RNA polymerase sigma-70 factor, ECF subfamily
VGLSFTSPNFEVEMTVSLESIYNDFHTKLYRFIAGRVPDGDTAEDILQDVYLKIHTHISGLRETDRLESWIYQIARNAIIDTYRRARPQEELSELLASPLDDESEAVSELASSVRGMLDCLPEAYRQALELTEFQGLSQVELADKLNISVSGAKSRVQRGRQKLKQAFLDCCHFEFDRLGKVMDYRPKCDHCAGNQYQNSFAENC